MRTPKILVIPGSNRAASWNAKLAGVLCKALLQHECEVMRITLRDYPLPIFDEDLEAQKGQPENALKLARLFHEHDGVVVVSPEYNCSVSPLTKNAIDWISRVNSDQRGRLSPYKHKVFGLASASPGRYGGVRGLVHLRASIGNCGALVISEQVCVSFAEKAFNASEELAEQAARKLVDGFAKTMVETTSLLTSRI